MKKAVETTDNHGIIGRHGGHVPLWYFLRSTALTEPTRVSPTGPLAEGFALADQAQDTGSALRALLDVVPKVENSTP